MKTQTFAKKAVALALLTASLTSTASSTHFFNPLATVAYAQAAPRSAQYTTSDAIKANHLGYSIHQLANPDFTQAMNFMHHTYNRSPHLNSDQLVVLGQKALANLQAERAKNAGVLSQARTLQVLSESAEGLGITLQAGAGAADLLGASKIGKIPTARFGSAGAVMGGVALIAGVGGKIQSGIENYQTEMNAERIRQANKGLAQHRENQVFISHNLDNYVLSLKDPKFASAHDRFAGGALDHFSYDTPQTLIEKNLDWSNHTQIGVLTEQGNQLLASQKELKKLTQEAIANIHSETKLIQSEVQRVTDSQTSLQSWLEEARHQDLEKERLALEREIAIQKQAAKIESYGTQVDLLSRLIAVKDPVLGKQVGAVGNAMVRGYQEFARFESQLQNLGTDLGVALLSGNFATIGLDLIGALANTGPTTDQLILDGISKLSSQVAALHQDMRTYFNAIDVRITDLNERISDLFKVLSQQTQSLERIERELLTVQNALLQMDQRLIRLFTTAQNERPMISLLARCLERQIHPEKWTKVATVNDCATQFSTHGSKFATDAISVPFDRPERARIREGEHYDLWHFKAIDENPIEFLPLLERLSKDTRYGLISPSQRVHSRTRSDSPMANPVEWALASHSWAELAETHPEFYRNLSRTQLRELIAQGKEILAYQTSIIPKDPADHAFFNQILEDYKKSIREFGQEMEEVRQNWVAQNAGGVDPWKGGVFNSQFNAVQTVTIGQGLLTSGVYKDGPDHPTSDRIDERFGVFTPVELNLTGVNSMIRQAILADTLRVKIVPTIHIYVHNNSGREFRAQVNLDARVTDPKNPGSFQNSVASAQLDFRVSDDIRFEIRKGDRKQALRDLLIHEIQSKGVTWRVAGSCSQQGDTDRSEGCGEAVRFASESLPTLRAAQKKVLAEKLLDDAQSPSPTLGKKLREISLRKAVVSSYLRVALPISTASNEVLSRLLFGNDGLYDDQLVYEMLERAPHREEDFALPSPEEAISRVDLIHKVVLQTLRSQQQPERDPMVISTVSRLETLKVQIESIQQRTEMDSVMKSLKEELQSLTAELNNRS